MSSMVLGSLVVIGAASTTPALAAPTAKLPAPVVSPSVVPAGTIATVSGTQCTGRSTGQPLNVYVNLQDPTGQVLSTATARPAADGTWSAALTPPVGTSSGRYAVAATCDQYTRQVAYTPRSVTVRASTAAAWTAQTPALPSVPNGTLRDVDCVTATACTSVGSTRAGGRETPLVETFDGSTWTVVPVTAPSAAGPVSLASVSCSSASSCAAVGEAVTGPGRVALVATSVGSTWTFSTLPLPSGQPETSLTAVSCDTSGSCLAVGSAGAISEGSRYVPIAYVFDGATWTPTAATGVSTTRARLTGVSCTARSSCTAVGQFYDRYPYAPLILAWNGTAWTTATLPAQPASTNWQLNDVDCVGATYCAAVGVSNGPPTYREQPLVMERSSSGTWAVTPVAFDPNTPARLTDVSCTGVAQCTASGTTGYQFDGSGQPPLFASPSASGWTGVTSSAQQLPHAISGLSCTASTCVVVGDDGDLLPRAAVGSPGSWADTTPGAPSGFLGGGFAGVACSSSTACTAVGSSTTSLLFANSFVPLVNRWDGTSWTRQTVPSGDSARYSSVTCPTTKFCIAVGGQDVDEVKGGTSEPLISEWRNGVWSDVAITSAPANGAYLTSVSCLSATSCIAVGQSNIEFGADAAVYTLAGTRWREVSPPLADATHGVSLGDVSCSVDLCRVVGTFYDADYVRRGVGLTWNGRTFAAAPSPGPAESVSCVSSGCVAIADPDYQEPLTASVWNGSTWTVGPVAYPATAAGSDVTAVACRASLACVAVGSGAGGPFVGARDGRGTWSQQPVSGPVDLRLSDVACPSTTACVAVGGPDVPVILTSPTR